MENVMEVVSENKKLTKGLEQSTINCSELLELQNAVKMFLKTSTAMKGRYVRFFNDIIMFTHSPLFETSLKQETLMKEYIEVDSNGEFKRQVDENGAVNPNATFIFKSDDDREKCEAVINKLWNNETEIKLPKLSKANFDELVIDTQKNINIGLIIKHLVH